MSSGASSFGLAIGMVFTCHLRTTSPRRIVSKNSTASPSLISTFSTSSHRLAADTYTGDAEPGTRAGGACAGCRVEMRVPASRNALHRLDRPARGRPAGRACWVSALDRPLSQSCQRETWQAAAHVRAGSRYLGLVAALTCATTSVVAHNWRLVRHTTRHVACTIVGTILHAPR